MNRIEFKVGQKVVAIHTHNNRQNSIIMGKIYVISEINYCGSCGVQRVGVGFYDDIKYTNCINGHREVCVNRVSSFSSHRFAPLDNLHESISEAEKNEDYELAQLLTEVLTENVELSELGI